MSFETTLTGKIRVIVLLALCCFFAGNVFAQTTDSLRVEATATGSFESETRAEARSQFQILLFKQFSGSSSSTAVNPVNAAALFRKLTSEKAGYSLKIAERIQRDSAKIAITWSASTAEIYTMRQFWLNKIDAQLKLATQLENRGLVNKASERRRDTWLLMAHFFPQHPQFASVTKHLSPERFEVEITTITLQKATTDSSSLSFKLIKNSYFQSEITAFAETDQGFYTFAVDDSFYTTKLPLSSEKAAPVTIRFIPFRFESSDEIPAMELRNFPFARTTISPETIKIIEVPDPNKPSTSVLEAVPSGSFPPFVTPFLAENWTAQRFLDWLRAEKQKGNVLFSPLQTTFEDPQKCFVFVVEGKGNLTAVLKPEPAGFQNLKSGDKLTDLTSFKGKTAIWVQWIGR